MSIWCKSRKNWSSRAIFISAKICLLDNSLKNLKLLSTIFADMPFKKNHTWPTILSTKNRLIVIVSYIFVNNSVRNSTLRSPAELERKADLTKIVYVYHVSKTKEHLYLWLLSFVQVERKNPNVLFVQITNPITGIN